MLEKEAFRARLDGKTKKTTTSKKKFRRRLRDDVTAKFVTSSPRGMTI